MRTLFILVALATFNLSFSQNYNMTLLDTVEFPGQELSNIWGYTANNGDEYALVGAADGMYIIDVSTPSLPGRIAQLTDGFSSSWREIKTFEDYAYITSEGPSTFSQGGLGVADLSGLPNTPIPFYKYKGDGAINNSLNRAHALDVDEEEGFVYLYGTTGIAGGGAVCLDLTDPYNPTYAGQYNDYYIHDGFSKNNMVYGSHIYEGYFSIIDFTNKSAPSLVATQSTPTTYTHNTWLTDDGNYLLTTDETSNSYLAMYDISDPMDIQETDRIRTTPGSGSIVHNTYVVGNHAVTSWYADGVTITDISRPGNLVQVARYDTYAGSGDGFKGCWGVYPFFPSGLIVASNIYQNLASGGNGGVMYILSSSYPDACYLEGTVTDASSGTNLFDVSVEIQHTDPLNCAASGLDGKFATGQPTSGTFDVEFSKAGYTTQTIQASLSPGAVVNLNVQLQPVALPLELVSFTAKMEGNKNTIKWTTSSEKNTLEHEVQRKGNPNSRWATLGKLPAAGAGHEETSYTFHDEYPFPESFYRLKTTDLDGDEHYSDIVAVKRVNTGLSIKSIYPVPSRGTLEINLNSDKAGEGEMSIGNFFGQVLLKKNIVIDPALNRFHLDLPKQWANGQYWVKFEDGERFSQSKFFLER